MLKLKRNKNIMMGMNINMNIFMNVIMFFHQFNVQRTSHVYLEVNVERKVQFRTEIRFNFFPEKTFSKQNGHGLFCQLP